jgi:hypothetical protein
MLKTIYRDSTTLVFVAFIKVITINIFVRIHVYFYIVSVVTFVLGSSLYMNMYFIKFDKCLTNWWFSVLNNYNFNHNLFWKSLELLNFRFQQIGFYCIEKPSLWGKYNLLSFDTFSLLTQWTTPWRHKTHIWVIVLSIVNNQLKLELC